MSRALPLVAVFAGILLAGAVARMPSAQQQPPAAAPTALVPSFKSDSTWPSLPNNWVLGEVTSIAVDSRDHIWVLHRPRSIPAEQRPTPRRRCSSSMRHGKLLGNWGGQGAGYDWPEREHGIFVDTRGSSGSAATAVGQSRRLPAAATT